MVSFRLQICHMYQIHFSLCVDVPLVKMTALYYECFQVIFSVIDVSEQTPFFRFQDREIAAIFDPPHHLKCIRKLFLEHNVTNVECEITVNGE